MAVFLEGLLPRFFPDLDFRCYPHEGKQDLVRSIPKILRRWKTPGDRFVVVHDNDRKDCRDLKKRLQARCREGQREDTLIRIACQELEAWYLGDLTALATAYDSPSVKNLVVKRKFRSPDEIQHPSREIKQAIKSFQKISGARLMARHIRLDENRSTSFHTFMHGITTLAERMVGDQDQ